MNLPCKIVYPLVSDHRWGSNTINIDAHIRLANDGADFDDKEDLFYQLMDSHNFIEPVRDGHVRLNLTDDLVEYLAGCGYDRIEVEPHLTRKYPSDIFDKHF